MDGVHLYFSLSLSLSHPSWIISVTISLTSLTPSGQPPSHCRFLGRMRLERRGKEADAHSYWRFLPSLFLPLQLTLRPATLTRLQTRLQHRPHNPIAGLRCRHPPSFSYSVGHPKPWSARMRPLMIRRLRHEVDLPPLSASRTVPRLPFPTTDLAVLDHLVATPTVDAVAFPSVRCTNGQDKLSIQKVSCQ
jgi:hypothetical protein